MGPVSNPEKHLSSECMFQNKNQTTSSNSRHVPSNSRQVPPEQTIPLNFGAKRRGRPTSNAARERSRVKTLRSAFLDLQRSLPAVPPDTKLSKLDVLVLATTYISHLMKTLNCVQSAQDSERPGQVLNAALHPVKKWPMRSRLYAGIMASAKTPPLNTSSNERSWTRFPSSP